MAKTCKGATGHRPPIPIQVLKTSLFSFNDLTPMDIAGFIIFALGLLCETVSDQQKFNFR